MTLREIAEALGVAPEKITDTFEAAWNHVEENRHRLITKEMIDQNRALIEECDILMMQLEIDWKVVEYAKDLAVSMGKMVIVDPAPALPGLPDSFWKGVSYIKPNETELEILVGRPVNK